MDLVEQFREFLINRHLTPPTVRGYVADVQQFMAWTGQMGLSLDKIAQLEARLYIDFLLNDEHQLRPGVWGHYSHATVQKKICSLSAFFDSLDMANE